MKWILYWNNIKLLNFSIFCLQEIPHIKTFSIFRLQQILHKGLNFSIFCLRYLISKIFNVTIFFHMLNIVLFLNIKSNYQDLFLGPGQLFDQKLSIPFGKTSFWLDKITLHLNSENWLHWFDLCKPDILLSFLSGGDNLYIPCSLKSSQCSGTPSLQSPMSHETLLVGNTAVFGHE